MAGYWPVIKEVAGFLGALCAAVPWLRDFWRRTGLGRIKAVRAAGSLKKVQNEIVAKDESWLARAKTADLVWTMTGLALIALSFLIGVFLTI